MFFTLTYIFYESFVASFYYNFIFHNLLLVEVGGFAPPSRTCFSLLHTAIILFSQSVQHHMLHGKI
jgi:hypothetical protein